MTLELRILKLKMCGVGLFMTDSDMLVLMRGDYTRIPHLIPENLFDMDLQNLLFLYPEIKTIDPATVFRFTDKGAQLLCQVDPGSWS